MAGRNCGQLQQGPSSESLNWRMNRLTQSTWNYALILLTLLSSGRPGKSSTWTEGPKRLVFIRVDFPDLQGAPFSDVIGTNLITGLNSFYTEMSYGRTGFAPAGAGSEIT